MQIARPQSGRGALTEMVLPFLVLAVSLLVLPLGLGLVSEGLFARIAIPAALAMVVALGFVLRPAAALLAFALYVMGRETLQVWLGTPIRQIDELAIPVLLAIAFVRYRPDRSGLFSPVRDGAVAFVVIAAVASSLLNAVPLEVWGVGLVLLLKGIAFLYVAMWVNYSQAELRGALAIVGSLAGLAFMLGLVELVAPAAMGVIGLERTFSPRGGLPSLRSFFFHPLMFGWFCAFAALFAHAHYVVYRRPWMLAVGIALSVGVFLSGRRRVMLALAGALAAGFGWHLRGLNFPAAIRAWLPSGAGTIILFLVFLPGLTGLLQMTAEQLGPGFAPAPTPTQAPILSPGQTPAPLPGGEPADDAFSVREGDIARVALYRGSVAIARDYFPLGAGLGRYGSWMSRVEYSPLYAQYGLDHIHGLRPSNPVFATDTFWPQILGELGVVGLAGYLVFVGWILLALWRAASHAVSPAIRALALAALLVFVQAVVESIAAPMFHSPPRIYLTYLAVGAALSFVRAQRGATHGRDEAVV